MDDYFRPLDGHTYMSLKTFRKSGAGVPTPVWFVEQGGVLYVTTSGDSGKVKRIRNSGAVEIAPCDMRGGLLGEFFPAEARILGEDTPEAKIARRLLMQKYGWQMRLIMLYYRLRGQHSDQVHLEIAPRETAQETPMVAAEEHATR